MRNSGAGVRLKKTPFPVSENEEKQETSLRNQAALSPLALFFPYGRLAVPYLE